MSEDSECSEEQDGEQYGHDVFQHYDVDCLSAEVISVESHFAYKQVWLGDPAYENTGADGNKWHEQVVADVIEDVENLSRCPIWQFVLKV